MSDHKIRVGASARGYLVVWCSCSPRDPLPSGSSAIMPLEDVNEIAHEHIESSERDSETDDVISGSRDYRAESLVTSEDVVTEPVELPEFWPRPFRR